MSTPEAKDRVRASRLRKKQEAQKKLTTEEYDWLVAYEKARVSTTMRTAKSAAASAPPGADAHVPREQLEVPGTSSGGGGSLVHSTRADAGIDASGFTWIPTMPGIDAGVPADDAPPAPGEPERPKEGTPLVDEPAKPPPDPVAAEKFAAMVLFLTKMGIASALDLGGDVAKGFAQAFGFDLEEAAKTFLKVVKASSIELANKYGLGGVGGLPPPELVVGVAVLGSGAAIAVNTKRRLLAMGKAGGARPLDKTAASSPIVSDAGPAHDPEGPRAEKSHLDELWSKKTAGDE